MKPDSNTTSGGDKTRQSTVNESESNRRDRLKRPIGLADVLIVKDKCPDIPDHFIYQLMFGGR